jgi:GntR family transcriptional regulator
VSLGQSTREPPDSLAAREPKYYRLKQHLLELIDAAEPGTLLPTERALAGEFGTSRSTVRIALQELVVEGRLDRQHGRGTFVAQPKLAQPLRLTSYTEDMRRQGFEPGATLLDLSTVRADPVVADRLRIAAGARVIVVERLRTANEVPMALERSHLEAARFPNLKRHLSKYTSLYTALREEYGVEPWEAEERIQTGVASPTEAALLQTDVGLPVLLMARQTFDSSGEPFEWVRSVYRGDRYELVARLTRPT